MIHLRNFTDIAERSAKEAKFMHDSLYTTLVKADHIVFKHNAYITILDEKHEGIDKIGDHHACRLGKWYDTEGKESLGYTKAFKALEKPHAAVHSKVLDTVGCVEKSSCLTEKDFSKIVANMKDVEMASFELFDLFKEMVKEGNPEVA